jgi:hypothetical protein
MNSGTICIGGVACRSTKITDHQELPTTLIAVARRPA